jgi:hypothetical protein
MGEGYTYEKTKRIGATPEEEADKCVPSENMIYVGVLHRCAILDRSRLQIRGLQDHLPYRTADENVVLQQICAASPLKLPLKESCMWAPVK